MTYSYKEKASFIILNQILTVLLHVEDICMSLEIFDISIRV